MQDLRGRNREKLSSENRKKVAAWLEDNPDKGMMDCSRELKLSYPTVRKHVNALKGEI